MNSNILIPKEMDKIVDRIYIGTYHSATMLDYSNRVGITHILNCTRDVHKGLKDFNVRQIMIDDGYEIAPDLVKFGIRTIEEAVKSGGKILVHCHAGISRSPSIVCAYLTYHGFSWDEAINFVQQKRPQIFPHSLVTLSVRRALGLCISPSTTLLGDNYDKS